MEYEDYKKYVEDMAQSQIYNIVGNSSRYWTAMDRVEVIIEAYQD